MLTTTRGKFDRILRETENYGRRGRSTLALKRAFGCVSMFRQVVPQGLLLCEFS